MQGECLSQKLDGDGPLSSKMTSPLVLQSIFSIFSIPEHPPGDCPFTGNILSPGDFRAQARGDGFEVKRHSKVVDPIHSSGWIGRSCKSKL